MLWDFSIRNTIETFVCVISKGRKMQPTVAILTGQKTNWPSWGASNSDLFHTRHKISAQPLSESCMSLFRQ